MTAHSTINQLAKFTRLLRGVPYEGGIARRPRSGDDTYGPNRSIAGMTPAAAVARQAITAWRQADIRRSGDVKSPSHCMRRAVAGRAAGRIKCPGAQSSGAHMKPYIALSLQTLHAETHQRKRQGRQ